MKRTKLFLSALLCCVLAACGGGDSTETTATAEVVTLPEVKYSTGCDAGSVASPFSMKTDITILGSLALATATVTVDVRKYSGINCNTQTMRSYAKGVVTMSDDKKTIVNESVTKIGRKGQFKVDAIELFGVALSYSPLGRTTGFVVVDEGDKLYFSRGSRDTDGYPSYLSLTPAIKQP